MSEKISAANHQAPRELPAHTLVGPHRNAGKHLVKLTTFLERGNIVSEVPGELPRSPERAAQLNNMTHAMQTFLAAQGLRLPPQRVPAPERFHFLPDEATLKKWTQSRGRPWYDGLMGYCDRQNIFVVEEGNAFNDMTRVNHEAIHFMAHNTWRPQPIKIKSVIPFRRSTLYVGEWSRWGYVHASDSGKHNFDLLGEVLIEMTNIYVAHKYWHAYDDLPQPASFVPGYLTGLLIGEEIITQAAIAQDLHPLDIFLPLAAGLFSGDMHGMHLLSKGLPREDFVTLMHAQRYEADTLLQQLDLPQTKAQLDRQLIESFDWFGYEQP